LNGNACQLRVHIPTSGRRAGVSSESQLKKAGRRRPLELDVCCPLEREALVGGNCPGRKVVPEGGGCAKLLHAELLEYETVDAGESLNALPALPADLTLRAWANLRAPSIETEPGA
jgi:hypothetical protein